MVSYVYTGKLKYYDEHENMRKIVGQLKSDKYVKSSTIVSWYEYYHAWLNTSLYRFELDKCKYYTFPFKVTNQVR